MNNPENPDTSLSDPVNVSSDDPTPAELERAMIMLETWGSTSYPPQRWERWRFAETYYAPEWLSSEDLGGAEPNECVTVLDYSLRAPEAPEGWKRVYQYAAGEKECPACERTGNAPGNDTVDGQPVCCPLCEGDGLLYEGEECQVVVFAPLKWTSEAGSFGCLYDNGPYQHDSKEDAIESLLEDFSDLSERYQARMRRDLETTGVHSFDRRIRPFAGADYCEISGPK